MPEGPEMRRAADELDEVLARRKAQRVTFGLRTLSEHDTTLSGRRIGSVQCRGKALLIAFSGKLTIYTHNQLYGKWFVRPLGELPTTNRQLRLRIDTREHSALLYSASDIHVLDPSQLVAHPYLSKLGPEALDTTVEPVDIERRLADKRFRSRSLAALYLDQAFLAGIGNYLRSEILFAARIAPALKASELDRAARIRLAKQSLSITRRSYRTGGVTNAPRFVNPQRAADVPRSRYRFFVFARAGQSCYICGTKIVRTTLSGRRLYYCPVCQSN